MSETRTTFGFNRTECACEECALNCRFIPGYLIPTDIAAIAHHLGYEKHSSTGNNSGNSRNGSTLKTLKGKRGQMEIEVPRDRNAEFEPQLVKKNQKRFDGLDEKIISLYARGMTTREIQGHLEEIYGVDVSPFP